MTLSCEGKRLLNSAMSTALGHNKRMENKKAESQERKATAPPMFHVGQKVVAKREEDGIWHTGLILHVNTESEGPCGDAAATQPKTLYQVAFTNAATGLPCGILPSEYITTDEKLIPSSEHVAESNQKSKLYPFSGEDSNPPTQTNRFKEGHLVIAKWTEEDGVWYRARIFAQVTSSIFIVHFIDYGNYDLVHGSCIVGCIEDIPEDSKNDEIDDNVYKEDQIEHSTDTMNNNSTEAFIEQVIKKIDKLSNAKKDEENNNTIDAQDNLDDSTKRYSTYTPIQEKSVVEKKYVVEESVIAKWSEDNVWYRAVIKEVDQEYLVHFIDYGNDALVNEVNIVKSKHAIPREDEIDEYVTDVGDEIKATNEKINEEATKSVPSEISTKKKYAVDDLVIAKWAEDNVWYRAVIKEAGENYLVQFTDYGNEDIVKEEHIVKTKDEIPKEEIMDEFVSGVIEEIQATTENQNKVSTKSAVAEKKYALNELVIAKWFEDNVWYNAVIKEVNEDYLVQFTDYGNEASVKEEHIVKSKHEISKIDAIDEFVTDFVEEIQANNENLNKECTKSAVAKKKYALDELVIAKWSEDNVWYNAVIKEVGGDYIVQFTDYGNEASVKEEHIAKSKDDIPKEDAIDEFVTGFVEESKATNENHNEESTKPDVAEKKYALDELVIAKWSEDNVWYNAVIKDDTQDYLVLFTDYGNEASVKEEHIVKSKDEIPKEDAIDEFVTGIVEESKATNENLNKECTESAVVKKKYVLDELVIAKWSEDNVWYNAVIKEINQDYLVQFTDYGNEASVKEEHIVKFKDEIPKNEAIDEFVVKSSGDDNKAINDDINGETANFVIAENPGTEKCVVSKYGLDERVIAQWSEDNVWYNAIIKEVGHDYLVLFSDYGNEAVVGEDHIVKSKDMIPSGNEIDEFVTDVGDEIKATNEKLNEKSKISTERKYALAEIVIAKWSEDNVWYNAAIQEVGHEYLVLFYDYGNKALVDEDHIVKSKDMIPRDNVIDEFVTCITNDVKSIKKIPSKVTKKSALAEKSAKKKYALNESVIAKWSEDNIWYRAIIKEEYVAVTREYLVQFIDYGNEALVNEDHIVKTKEEIPEVDVIDEYVIVHSKKYTLNEAVIFKWSKDNIWYRGVIKEIRQQDYAVKFTDYPKVEFEKEENIIKDIEDIPAKSLVDDNVYNGLKVNEHPQIDKNANRLVWKPKYEDGLYVIAKWAETTFWYRAVIMGVEGNKYRVSFVDYGNEDLVSENDIVLLKNLIPQGELIDENVNFDQILDSFTIAEQSNQKFAKYKYKVGQAVIAKFDEDKVWYRAIILEQLVVTEGFNGYMVQYTDYGNEACVNETDIVLDVDDIKHELIDEHVMIENHVNKNKSEIADEIRKYFKSCNSKYQVGQEIIAQWQEDKMWYRAQILELVKEGYLVRFTDYGNEDVVTDENIVMDIKMIPVADVIDECVQTPKQQDEQNLPGPVVVDDHENVNHEHVQTINKQEEKNINAEIKPKEFQINQEVIAKWQEDNTWYRAVILKPAINADNWFVRFLDYGNEDKVALSDIVLGYSTIPKGDLIDDYVDQKKETLEVDNQENTNKIVDNTKLNEATKKTLSSVIIEAEMELVDEIKAAADNNKTMADYNMRVPIEMMDLTNNNVTLPLHNTIQDKDESKASKDKSTPGKVKEIIEKLNQLHVSPPQDVRTISPPQASRTKTPPQAAKTISGQASASKTTGKLKPKFNSNVVAVNPKTGKKERGIVMGNETAGCYSVYFLQTENAEMITENSILQVEKDPVVDKNPGKKILVQDLEDSDEEVNFKVPELKDMFDIPVPSPVGVSGYAGKVFISSKSGDQVLVYKSGTAGLVNRITAKPCPQQVLALQDGGLAVTTKKGLIIMDSRLQVVKELRCAKYGNIFGLAQQSKSSLLVVRTCHHKRESVSVNSIDLTTFDMKPLFSIQGVETPWMTFRRGNLYIVDDNTCTVLVYSWITGQINKQMSPNIQNVGFGDLVVTKTGAVISVQHEDNKLHVFSPDFEYAGSILIPGLREDQDAFGVGLYLDDLTDLLYITLHGLDTVKVVKLL